MTPSPSSGGPTDLEILRALAEGGDRPRSAADLGARLGLPPARVPVRLASLVSLGYAAPAGDGDGYALTERGAAALRRRGEEPAP